MRHIKEYLIGDDLSFISSLSPIEQTIANQMYPKIKYCNEGIIDVDTLRSLGTAIVNETSRATNIDKRILEAALERLYDEYLDEIVDARYSDKDIEKYVNQHKADTSKPATSKPVTSKSYAVLHHDGSMWKVKKHPTIEDATKDYVKKSTQAKRDGTRVKIVDHEGTVIHSTN